MSNWHCLESAEVLRQLDTTLDSGLSHGEAAQRLAHFGINELRERPPKSPWLMLWEQFTATTVLVLIVAAFISAAFGDLQDTAAILAIVMFNGLFGFAQEYRAGQEFAALKKMAVPKARVLRQGEWQEILARDLVPGDIIQLEDGDQVPADARLLDCTNLRTQEATFTGESNAVEKSVAAIPGADIPLGDRHNLVFMGTIVIYGRGRAVVTETGMATELGQIADSIQSVQPEQTPLQRRLDHLGRRLAVIALALVVVIFAFGMMRGEDLETMLLTAVSLAVAIIPEGLPAVVTIALAIGSQRMLKRRALIRKLPAVETLGSVTTICADKTGTLTENRMTVTILSLAGQRVELRESFAEITSWLDGQQSYFHPGQGTQLPPPLAVTLVGSALCNNALLPERPTGTGPSNPADADVPKALGDPTEIALVVAADRLGLDKADLEQLFPRKAEAPFDSDRKRMTTIHQVECEGDRWRYNNPSTQLLPFIPTLLKTPYIAITKGSVDGLLQICSRVWVENRTEPLDLAWMDHIRDHNDRLASAGTRVLGLAVRPLEILPPPGHEVTVE
ncbi:MAG TPA: HAD-IC family P-type ATPase, partial [Leptolyngbyaceae cyanobacterium M65_K2018_010]|nr:HAD-IC family P-type ATPase [Leptolyngbyaceae cyanobacterium M65_K2018_010]